MKEAPRDKLQLTMSIRRDFPVTRTNVLEEPGQKARVCRWRRETLGRAVRQRVWTCPGWLKQPQGAGSILSKNRVGKNEERNDEES
jgi:hypothetical protein